MAYGSLGLASAPQADPRQEILAGMTGPQKALTAIGDFGAAMRGVPGPLDQMVARRQQEEERMLRRQEMKLGLISNLADLPPEARAMVAENFAGLPQFEDLPAIMEKIDATSGGSAEQIRGISGAPDDMVASAMKIAGGDPIKALDILSSPEVQTQIDHRNQPEISRILMASGEAPRTIGEAKSIAKEIGLTPSHIATLERNPSFARSLGIQPVEDEAAASKPLTPYEQQSLAIRRREADKPPVQVFTGDQAQPQEFIDIKDEPFLVKRDENGKVIGVEPLQGTKTAEERALEAEKKISRQEQKESTTYIVTDEIKRSLEKSNKWTTGFFGQLLQDVGGTPQHDLKTKLDPIKANIGFDRIQRMREESPTGGSLGNVSNFEVDTLQTTAGSLVQSQSQEDFEYNLKRLYNLVMDATHGTVGQIQGLIEVGKVSAEEAAPLMDRFDLSSGEGPSEGDIEDGYRFKGGDPADSANWEKVS